MGMLIAIAVVFGALFAGIVLWNSPQITQQEALAALGTAAHNPRVSIVKTYEVGAGNDYYDIEIDGVASKAHCTKDNGFAETACKIGQ